MSVSLDHPDVCIHDACLWSLILTGSYQSFLLYFANTTMGGTVWFMGQRWNHSYASYTQFFILSGRSWSPHTMFAVIDLFGIGETEAGHQRNELFLWLRQTWVVLLLLTNRGASQPWPYLDMDMTRGQDSLQLEWGPTNLLEQCGRNEQSSPPYTSGTVDKQLYR